MPIPSHEDFIKTMVALSEEEQARFREDVRLGRMRAGRPMGLPRGVQTKAFAQLPTMPNPYSISNAIKCALAGSERGFKRASGFELEQHQELLRALPAAKGFLVPIMGMLPVKAQSALIGPSGGFTVGDAVPVIADALRPYSVALNAGAIMLDLAPNAVVPRIESGSTAYWLAETEECPEGGAEFTAMTLSPRRCAAWLKASNQLLAQGQIADVILSRDIRAAVGSALDLGIFSGVGGAEPIGLLNSSDVLNVTFGNAPNRAELAAMERKLGDENANDLNATWVTSPTCREKWRNTKSDSTGISFLWDDGDQVLGRPAYASNNITENRALLGNFSDLLILNWGVLEISDPFTAKKSHATEFLVEILADAAPIRGKSFVVTTDSAAQ